MALEAISQIQILLLKLSKGIIMKEQNWKELPTYLSHKPVCYVDFQDFKLNLSDYNLDSEDAKYYSIGLSTWHPNENNDPGKYSMKVFRTCMDDDNRWSPQAEELPVWRVLNMTLMFLSAVYGDPSIFVDSDCSKRSHTIKIRKGCEPYFDEIKRYLEDYPGNKVLLKEIKRILNSRKDL